MSDLPVKLENMVMATKGDQKERREIKAECAKVLWSTVCELLPDKNLTTHEMKYVYYGVTADGYHPKYSNLRFEVTYQIWMMVEHTNEVFFPQSVRDMARKYINDQGFLNTLNLYRRATKGMPVKKDIKLGPEKYGYNLVPWDESFIEDMIEADIHKMGNIDEELGKWKRNVKDRKRYDDEKQQEQKTNIEPLLVKKRNSKPSASSIKQNVELLTKEGVKQVDIASRLGISTRRVRQIQKGEK